MSWIQLEGHEIIRIIQRGMYLLTWYWQYLYPVCHKSFEHKAKSIKKEQKNTEGPKRFHFALTYLQTVIFFRQILLWNMEIWIRSLSLSLPHCQHRSSSFYLAPSENSFCIQNKNVLLFTRYMNVYIIFFIHFLNNNILHFLHSDFLAPHLLYSKVYVYNIIHYIFLEKLEKIEHGVLVANEFLRCIS